MSPDDTTGVTGLITVDELLIEFETKVSSFNNNIAF